MAGRPIDEVFSSNDDFGGWLRGARERAGVTLEEVAHQTKISSSRIRALERNDVSGWPGGVFRRGFVRSYATMVGLEPDDTLTAFLQAFPENEAMATAGPLMLTSSADPCLRLTLAEAPTGWRPMVGRLGAAITDAVAPIVLALPSGLLGDWSLFWVVLAVVAVVYLAAGTLVLGMTPGMRMMQRATAYRSRSRYLTGINRVMTQRGTNDVSLDHEVSHAHR